jgi:hypothetical protein
LLAAAVYFGLTDGDYTVIPENIPIELLTELVPAWLVVAASGLVFVPGIVILLLGLSVLSQKNLVGGKFGLVALALWLLCIGITGFHIPKIVGQFKEENKLETKTEISLSPGILILKVNDVEDEELYNKAGLRIIGTKDSVVNLTQEFYSRGKTKDEALENAGKLNYSYSVMDSVITFEEGYDLNTLETFRGQRISLTLEIPYNKPFIMERSMLEILENTIQKNGFRRSDVRQEAVWVLNEAGLVCLTCPQVNGKRKSWDEWEEEKPKTDSLNKARLDSISKAKFKNAFFMND